MVSTPAQSQVEYSTVGRDVGRARSGNDRTYSVGDSYIYPWGVMNRTLSTLVISMVIILGVGRDNAEDKDSDKTPA